MAVARAGARLLAAAADQKALPDGFAATIKPAPTPAERAVIAVIENDPATLSFSDWEYVLSHRDASWANEAAAKKVWQTIQAKQNNGTAKLAIPVKVISSDEKTIQAAVTDDNQQANKADLEVGPGGATLTTARAGNHQRSRRRVIGLHGNAIYVSHEGR